MQCFNYTLLLSTITLKSCYIILFRLTTIFNCLSDDRFFRLLLHLIQIWKFQQLFRFWLNTDTEESIDRRSWLSLLLVRFIRWIITIRQVQVVIVLPTGTVRTVRTTDSSKLVLLHINLLHILPTVTYYITPTRHLCIDWSQIIRRLTRLDSSVDIFKKQSFLL